MPHDHPFGTPVSVLSTSDSKEVIVDEEELQKLFSHQEIQDRKIVILSTIGAFRGGKSFFLDYCLRFLYAHFSSINNPKKETQFIFEKHDNWMGCSEEPLKGFSWVSGTKRDTTGILIWSDIFLHTIDSSGEKIAIFVMDTQGLFDTESTPTDNSRIFALGTLISSIQVLNLKSRIQEDQLQYLQFATEFAKFNAKQKGALIKHPFQNLTFLIRDWENDEEFEFGIDGGRRYFEEVLEITKFQMPELVSVRESIKSSFETIECCLLPHPGKNVARRKDYDGRWSEMDEEFKEELKKVIELLLLPENMILKKVNSQELTGKELKNYITQYFKIFQSDDVPETLTIYELTVESNMNNLIKKCIADYKSTIFRNKNLVNHENIVVIHEKCKERALKLYDKENKMGSIQHEEKFKAKLDEEIEATFNFYTNQNDFLCQDLEEEAERQQEILDKEEQQRLEVEEAKNQAEIMLKELKKSKHKMEEKEYERQIKIVEARRDAEIKRLQSIDNQASEENSFSKFLALIIATIAAASFPFIPGVVSGTVAIRTVASVVVGTISYMNRCSIM